VSTPAGTTTGIPRTRSRPSGAGGVVVAALLVVALGAAACGGGSAEREPSASWSTAYPGPAGGGPMMGDGGTMMGDGGTMMGDVDEEHYLVDMVSHHLDAITAAEQLARSDDPAMRRFGRRIVSGQTAQVEQMRGWLERWYPDAPASTYVPMMSDLSSLSGAELDRTFLSEMVRHHMVAVMMSHRLLRGGGAVHSEVASLAQDVVRVQTAEIAWMRRRLSGSAGGVLTPGDLSP
jgi:uncharacterized protein (DUF305 family)